MGLGLTAGDWIAIALAAGAWAQLIYLSGADKRAARRADVKQATDLASADAGERVELGVLKAELTDIKDTLREQAANFHKHEVECAKDKTALRSSQTAIQETQTAILNRLGTLQREISNMALGLAPSRGLHIPDRGEG